MAIIPCKQLSLADVFSDCQEIYESDKPEFLSLLQSNIDLDEIIPDSFRNHFYASTGRPVNTLYMPFCGHLSSNGFFQSLRILYFLFSLSIPDIFVNSVILIKSLMLLKLPVSNRIFWRTYNQSLITLLMLPNLSARLLILPKQI